MTRDEIVALIREKYDPEPKDWPRHRGWDDGAGDIADAILADPKALNECPLCKLKASSGLHRFCTRGECPVRS